MKSKILLQIAALLLLTSCMSLDIRAPYYRASNVKNDSKDWEIQLADFGLYRDVRGNWWGKDFYIAEIRVKNVSQKYKFYQVCNNKLKEFNFNYILSRNPNIKAAYQANPEQFDKEGFLQGFPQMKLIVEIPSAVNHPVSTYSGKPVFPNISGNLFAAAMVACEFGTPMSRDTDRASTSSGWLSPGESTAFKVVYSIPNGAIFLKLDQTGYFSTDLTSDTERK
ncbi:hypothetical protein [Leptospira sarikeiensis]|uniref:Lipoprotein n=1 Tax=Leptospira sarikeiensis TaxID=2484943 RepID=A0A4R9KGF1_9LEPT|nr:hypothetical protein [Leptospira sarikeiensis]TGL64322.1 hypothetical protein EHQ64_03070 [Leptospira sarikeiensis]